jgi:Na+/melibiose symporter-like transporter
MTECRDKTGKSMSAGLVGWPFVLSSIGVFLVPLVLGLTCAVLAGGSDTRRFLYGTAGLLVGMLASASTYRIFSHSRSSKKETNS